MPEDKAPTIDITTGEVRIESVTKLYEKIDKAIDDVTDTDKMSFHEIDVALLRINHKLDQEKMRVFLQYIADEKLNSTNSTGIYK